MRRLRVILMTAGLAAALGGCTAASVVEKLPDDMGLPAGAPARPANAYEYPAVHDMPPPRPEPALSVDQQMKVESELRAVRDRQENRADPAPKKKKPAKQPDPDENTGSKTRP